MFIRFSTEKDKPQICELIKLCFDGRENHNGIKDLNGRYLLAFDKECNVLAMTGLMWSNEYNAYEIDWTCTHPKHRKSGIMHELFKRICALTDEAIYCSCWRLSDDRKINLYSLMRDFGFQEVITNRATWDVKYNCTCGAGTYCMGRKSKTTSDSLEKSSCRCYEDLYLREARQ